jgi:hypothetical protein
MCVVTVAMAMLLRYFGPKDCVLTILDFPVILDVQFTGTEAYKLRSCPYKDKATYELHGRGSILGRAGIFSKITAFWGIAPCSLAEVDCFRCAYCLHHPGTYRGCTHLRNVGLLQQNYTKQYTRRLSSSYSPP